MATAVPNPILLASASPRRKALLRQIGVPFQALPMDVDETPKAGEQAADYVLRLAVAKAQAGRAQQPMATLGADTVVIVDNAILGKPRDQAHAEQMLMQLSGRAHAVLTAVALVDERGLQTRLSTSRVWMRKLSDEEIAAYWRSGEPRDKAGAYAIQGFGATFIERLEGSYSGVMGLPLFETAELLRKAQEVVAQRFR